MSPEAIKNFLTAVVLPVVVAAVTTWLFASVHVFSLFGITEGQIGGELIQLGTFGISAGLTWLFAHFHLTGAYTPAARLAKAGVQFAPIAGRSVLGEVEHTDRGSR